MAKKKIKKLSQLQKETLESFRRGEMLTVEAHNFPWLGDRTLLPSIRYFLTDNDLVARVDESRPVGAKGNGLIISEKGVAMLAQQLASKKTKSENETDKLPEASNAPTERQIAYANSLGIDIPVDATLEEVSDLISARVGSDMPANERQKSMAALYGVKFTRFTGKQQLATRILNAVKRPTHENDLAAWFIYKVYRDLTRGTDDTRITGPDHPTITELVSQFVVDEAAP